MEEEKADCCEKACRPDYSLTELIHKYIKMKKSSEFRYCLQHSYLNRDELITLIEFFNCNELIKNDVSLGNGETNE